jgi:dihydrodipicolinate synthase/N-acetylneuraminate lyase
MASAFPDVVRSALDAGDAPAMDTLRALRVTMEASGQFIASAKHALGMRGVGVRPAMRAPLRMLSPGEAADLESGVAPFLRAASPA